MAISLDTIIHDDVLGGLSQIDDNFVHLIFTSPPYNLKVSYGNSLDDMPYSDYIDWLSRIMRDCKRVLVPGGRLAINIDAMTNRQDDNNLEYIRPIYADLVNIGREIGLLFRTEICWYKQNVVGRKTAYGSYLSCSNPVIRRNHEYILVWSNGDWKLEGDSELSDMTSSEFNNWTMSTWDIKPETRKLNLHPAAFPVALADRVIRLFTYRGNTVLDIFSGTGTTACAAQRVDRRYIGIDNDLSCCNYSKNRIKAERIVLEQDYIPRSQRLKMHKENNGQVFQVDIFNG